MTQRRGFDNWTTISISDARRWFEPESETVRLISNEDSVTGSKLDIEVLILRNILFMPNI